MSSPTSAAINILVINVTRIGDTLLTTPSLRAIAAANPGARLTFLGHPKRVEVMRHLPYVSKVASITKFWAPFLGHLSGKRYDLAFVFGFDEPLVAYALRVAERVVAFRQKDDALNRCLYRIAEACDPMPLHAVDYLLQLPEAAGFSPDGRQLDYVVTPEEAQWAHEELARTLPTPCQGLIGLQVASFPTRAYRDWPLEHFIDLTGRIRSAWPNAHFLIFGGSEERVRTEQLAKHLGSAATLYAGQLTLRQTGALMNEIDLYIGVDTGPTHLMGALHRPMIALYHSKAPSRRLRPLDHPSAYIIDHPTPESEATADTKMADISVECVWRSVDQALAEHPPAVR
ncbi:MAG: glycosyltransferase family 9 protein [Betaproteobacteria bacterium]